MSKNIPPLFKPLACFIRRGEELDKDTSKPESKLVAFSCRQYAMELGIEIHQKQQTNEGTEFLMSLMNDLEEEKNKMPYFSQDEIKQVCENFAMDIFIKADDEDRLGHANKNTARTFYVAGILFDILKQFGEMDVDILQKIKYCKFKAADILKSIKEGKKPKPGSPKNDIKLEIDSVSSTPDIIPSADTKDSIAQNPTEKLQNANGICINMSSMGQVPNSSIEKELPDLQEFIHVLPPGSNTNASSTILCKDNSFNINSNSDIGKMNQILNTNETPSESEINDAIECAKFAIAALKIKDINLAVKRLQDALSFIK